MIVRRFLLWCRNAPPGHRAEATAALANAYLHSDLSRGDRSEAETALTAMLDDPSPVVRRAMAEALGSSPLSPRHIVVALAGDQSEIAELVLARSPVLIDADLVDCAALGDERVQCAIAARPYLSGAACAALGEIGRPGALTRLAGNPGAEIPHATLSRMVERHGGEASLREALLSRPDLPVDIAQAIAAALARALQDFVAGCGWLSPERSGRVAREARERTTVALSAGSGPSDVERLVAHLRVSAQLTPALILRAILSRQTAFVEAAFAELTGMSARRVAAMFRDPCGLGFRALFGKTGLPLSLRPAFEAAISANREQSREGPDGRAVLSRRVVERALRACAGSSEKDSALLVALLRRYATEAARDEARHRADGLADEAALAIVLEQAPHILDDDGRGRRALAA